MSGRKEQTKLPGCIHGVVVDIARIGTRSVILVYVLTFLVCVCYICIFIRINCSFKNKKLKKQRKKIRTTCQRAQRQMHTNGGNVNSAGWQVILCDPIWHVSSRSGEASR